MNPNTFDRVSKLFAARKLSRRQALTGGSGLAGAALAGVGGAPAAAQEATPATIPAEPWDGEKTTYLFVQSFHSGSITPVENQEGRYTVTLDQGTGQTIYFADRPSRDVGATDTAQFLEGLGFTDDNPPNAALIVETAPGETDVAVVELFNPTHDPTTDGVTYDVEVLETWRSDLELGLQEDPTDLAEFAPAFSAAHLLIDDCPRAYIMCQDTVTERYVSRFPNIPYCWAYDNNVCIPCEPYGGAEPTRCATRDWWSTKCNKEFPDRCQGRCKAAFSLPAGNNMCNR